MAADASVPASGGSATPLPAPPGAGRWRRHAVTAVFLGPALIFLAVWIVYPTIRTVIRSFFDRNGDNFVWFDNYKTLFTSDTLVKAIENNAIWLAVVPATVVAIGLIFAVLTERIRWSVAFKIVVFMPMAISLFASGVIWHIMFQKDPDQGAVNAAIKVVRDAVVPAGVLTSANSSTPAVLRGNADQGFVLRTPLRAGGTAPMGLTAIPPAEVPQGAAQAVQPQPQDGAITGVVWRDFRPGGGKPGVVERGEQGIPGATVNLQDASGKVVKTEKTAADGSFTFSGVGSGTYRAAINKDTFAKPFDGVAWLGPKLITPACIIAYIWVWAGFSMVVIAAGLAAISREVLEAARTDGATEWQVFRRITVPMLAPVLTVVFVTMLINVLKVFDIILSVAPGSSQDDANVIALAMWRTSFGGVNDFGLGSAIATFLFLLVIPALLLNVRRFKRES
jgi:alpha-glucoside transport system permease protein